ncbi:histamine H2 receptor-like [Pocillopora verrucosa]|uniref:histamine H2 receptor-like n=1 Tax=Pocillopora verrucosa TaxID=203993 RepID=UPI003342946E
MASNSCVASHNITSLKHQRSLSTSSCIPWIAVLSIECLAIIILNITTIIVFVKQRQLQRKSTYLIIHLAIADLLVGAISGPMQVYAIMAECYGKIWDITFSRISLAFFPFASLVNLAFISLERVHATYRPFKHRLIKKWVYGLVIAFIYLSTICKGTIEIVTDWPLNVIWVYCSYFILLVLVCLCYISIYIKVRCCHQHQLHGAAGLRERKLTSTSFLVTSASLLTFLPLTIWESMIFLHVMSIPNWSTYLQIGGTILTLFLANSLINPILYAVRMPEFRVGISKLIYRRMPQDHRNPVEYPLRNL